MPESINAVHSQPKRVLMVVANPAVSTTLGVRVGFWASELTHPYYEFTEAGYEVEIASPNGGRVELDRDSDPRDPGGYSAHDLISMGFLNTARLAALLADTKRLADVSVEDYDAIVVTGGQAPMFTFREDRPLQRTLAAFYEAEKVTAALCHGVSALLDVRLSNGNYLIDGKTITGFANVEEDFVDRLVGRKVMPYRVEDEARRRGANYIQLGLWRAHAVRDGNLITGQQQYSGREVARLVIEALGR
jgi:putative intracellular protease/amidase